MAPGPHGAQVLLDPDYGSKNVFATSLVLLSFHQSAQLRLQTNPDPILDPLTPGLGSGLGEGGQDLTKCATTFV